MKVVRIVLLSLFVVGVGLAAWIYFTFIGATAVPRDLPDPSYVYIPSGSSFEEVIDTLQQQGLIKNNERAFRLLSERMKYQRDPMRAGRYAVQPGMTMLELIRHLRGGPQAPVNVVLNIEREPMNVAAKAARAIEPDSVELLRLFQDTAYLDSIGYTPQTLQSLFIPNTYEFFWNTTPRSFVERMLEEHDKFWAQNNRRAKAEALGLSPAEVYTLASIVEKETLVNTEKPRMAGVYLNRLRIGMRLQADPTAVFATRDFDTPRVLDYHTQFDSPYNTYRYAGLPPGPIAMSTISSIDGVLNAEKHDFLYFCAVGDGSGLHNFAETLAGHGRNIQIYVDNLRRRGLR